MFKASLLNQVTRSVRAGTTKDLMLSCKKADLPLVGRKEGRGDDRYVLVNISIPYQQ